MEVQLSFEAVCPGYQKFVNILFRSILMQMKLGVALSAKLFL